MPTENHLPRYILFHSVPVKRSGRQADHSSPLRANVMNVWTRMSTPLWVFVTCTDFNFTVPTDNILLRTYFYI